MNTKRAAWLLGNRLSLAALANDRGIAAKSVPEWFAEAQQAAKILKTTVPELPSPAASGDTEPASKQVMNYLLVNGQRIGHELTKQYGSAEASLFEVALKSNLLLLIYRPGTLTVDSVSAAIQESAGGRNCQRSCGCRSSRQLIVKLLLRKFKPTFATCIARSINISRARRSQAGNECYLQLAAAMAAVYFFRRTDRKPAYVGGTTAARAGWRRLGSAGALAVPCAINRTPRAATISRVVCCRICLLDDGNSLAATSPSADKHRLGGSVGILGRVFASFRRFVPSGALSICVAPLVGSAIVWTGLESARAHLLTGFLMASVAHTQVNRLTLIQFSDIVGEYGVDFLILLVAACVTQVILISGPPSKGETISRANGAEFRSLPCLP